MTKLYFCFFCMATAGLAQHEAGPAMSAGLSLERLEHGNHAFLTSQFDAQAAGQARRAAVAVGQHPFATILACADSRVAPELVFAQGLGDLFVVRVAGAVADKSVLGSIEYAAEHLNVPLLVVMGHTSCGAVRAALDSKPPAAPDPAGANLEHLLSFIRPALPHASATGSQWNNAVYASVEQTTSDVIRLSPVLEHLASTGKMKVAGAVYELDSGRVKFLGSAGNKAESAAKSR